MDLVHLNYYWPYVTHVGFSFEVVYPHHPKSDLSVPQLFCTDLLHDIIWANKLEIIDREQGIGKDVTYV